MKFIATIKNSGDVMSNDLFDPLVSNEERQKAIALVNKFVEDDEYLYVEFDTETGTAKLLEADFE